LLLGGAGWCVEFKGFRGVLRREWEEWLLKRSSVFQATIKCTFPHQKSWIRLWTAGYKSYKLSRFSWYSRHFWPRGSTCIPLNPCPCLRSEHYHSGRPLIAVRRCRSWRTDVDGGTSVMVCVSVEFPNVKSVSGCVRAQTFASHFCLQPRGSAGCRLTHLSQADIRYQFSLAAAVMRCWLLLVGKSCQTIRLGQ